MTPNEAKTLTAKIESEGFEYAFLHYSNFSTIKDERFHELRKAFVKSYEELKSYLEEQGVD